MSFHAGSGWVCYDEDQRPYLDSWFIAKESLTLHFHLFWHVLLVWNQSQHCSSLSYTPPSTWVTYLISSFYQSISVTERSEIYEIKSPFRWVQFKQTVMLWLQSLKKHVSVVSVSVSVSGLQHFLFSFSWTSCWMSEGVGNYSNWYPQTAFLL